MFQSQELVQRPSIRCCLSRHALNILRRPCQEKAFSARRQPDIYDMDGMGDTHTREGEARRGGGRAAVWRIREFPSRRKRQRTQGRTNISLSSASLRGKCSLRFLNSIPGFLAEMSTMNYEKCIQKGRQTKREFGKKISPSLFMSPSSPGPDFVWYYKTNLFIHVVSSTPYAVLHFTLTRITPTGV